MPPGVSSPKTAAEALRSYVGHATSNRRIVCDIAHTFPMEFPLCAAKPSKSPIRSISNADWEALVKAWKLTPKDGLLLYDLAARGTFNPEGGTTMPKESPVSSISNADWNELVRQWKVSHGQLPDIAAGGHLNPEAGTAMPKDLDLLLPDLAAGGHPNPEAGTAMPKAEACVLLATSCP